MSEVVCVETSYIRCLNLLKPTLAAKSIFFYAHVIPTCLRSELHWKDLNVFGIAKKKNSWPAKRAQHGERKIKW